MTVEKQFLTWHDRADFELGTLYVEQGVDVTLEYVGVVAAKAARTLVRSEERLPVSDPDEAVLLFLQWSTCGRCSIRSVVPPSSPSSTFDGAARLRTSATAAPAPTAELRADALVEMANRSRSAHAGGVRPRPLITVLAGEATLAQVCELANGQVIAPGQIVPLLADADLETIVFDGARRVMSVSFKRTPVGALAAGDRGARPHGQHPSGCDEPAARCDVDHVTPWVEGGETSQVNGRLGCWYHNRIERSTAPTPLERREESGRTPPDAA